MLSLKTVPKLVGLLHQAELAFGKGHLPRIEKISELECFIFTELIKLEGVFFTDLVKLQYSSMLLVYRTQQIIMLLFYGTHQIRMLVMESIKLECFVLLELVK